MEVPKLPPGTVASELSLPVNLEEHTSKHGQKFSEKRKLDTGIFIWNFNFINIKQIKSYLLS